MPQSRFAQKQIMKSKSFQLFLNVTQVAANKPCSWRVDFSAAAARNLKVRNSMSVCWLKEHEHQQLLENMHHQIPRAAQRLNGIERWGSQATLVDDPITCCHRCWQQDLLFSKHRWKFHRKPTIESEIASAEPPAFPVKSNFVRSRANADTARPTKSGVSARGL